MVWRTGDANEYLVVTGALIKDVKLCKKAWIWPGQKCSKIHLSAEDYTFQLHAMSSEKLPFILPAQFAIGPLDEEESLLKYAKRLASHKDGQKHVHEIVKGIVEGETRVVAAGMTMESIFKGTKEFKNEIFDKVQLELNQIGLHIYNANIKQLQDTPGSEYFSLLSQKVQQEASNKTKVEVAEAKFKGDTGVKERQGQTSMNAAKVNSETAIYEKIQSGATKQQEIKIDNEVKVYATEQQAKIAQASANFAILQADLQEKTKIAEIESAKNASICDAEMERVLETKKAEAMLEKLRAKKLAKAKVDYEVSVQATNAELYQRQQQAEAQLYTQKTNAQGLEQAANAELYQRQQQAEAQLYTQKTNAQALQQAADAQLYTKKKEAEGIQVLAEAQSKYIKSMLEAFEGDYHTLHDYLLLDRGVYQKMGEINAGAIKGLQPKISVWTTGSSGDAATSAAAPIADLFKMLPPLYETIKDQTGITPLPFLGTLPKEQK